MAAVRGVTFGYRRGQDVLRNLTLDVRRGEFLAVMGPSGCGKTTVLRLLAGQLKPAAGQIAIGYRRVGIVYQEDGLLPWLSVKENAELPLRFGPSTHEHLAPEAALQAVAATDYRNFYPHELSGGMKRRVELARILTSLSDLWLLDEPFEGLDYTSRQGLLALIVKEARERSSSVALVTHTIDDVVTCANRVLVLTQTGECAKALDFGGETPRDLAQDSSHEFKKTLIAALEGRGK